VPKRYADRMDRQRLVKVVVEGFTSISSATVELRALNVLVGANGAGKSNLIRAFTMLGSIFAGDLRFFVGEAGGAGALLHAGNEEATTVRFEVHSPTAGYSAELVRDDEDSLIFSSEGLWSPIHTHVTVPLGRGHRETHLSRAGYDTLPGAEPTLDAIRGSRVYHFNNTGREAPAMRSQYTADNQSLHPDAGNIAPVLLQLRERDTAAYERIVATVRLAAPFFRDFVLEPELAPDRVRLRWRQEGSYRVFPASALSDGTLRFICLTTLLRQPELASLVILDEPELGLHPFAISLLAEMLQAASTQSQVLIATQSVTLMNQFALDDLIVAERRQGASVFERPDPDKLRDWLSDYSLGELWEMNILGGRPGPERG
jgi:predicted ATPase